MAARAPPPLESGTRHLERADDRPRPIGRSATRRGAFGPPEPTQDPMATPPETGPPAAAPDPSGPSRPGRRPGSRRRRLVATTAIGAAACLGWWAWDVSR